MKPRQELGVHRSQQSVFYYSDLLSQEGARLGPRPNYFNQLYPHMLIEDVSLGIMPIGGRTEKKPFRVFVVPQDTSTEELITDAIARGAYSRDFAGSVCDFFHDCAQTIMAFGEAVYEIVYLSQQKNGAAIGFELMFIQPFTVMHYRGKLVQYIPADVARERNLPQYLQLSPERILRFKLPDYLRGKHSYIMESLGFLSGSLFPEFALQGAASGSRRIPYDSSAHIRSQKLALAQAGKLIGWNARGLLQEEALEYYWLRRQLLFERFRIELRNGILVTLNDAVDRAGREIGFSARVEIEGLPTLEDVDAALAHLQGGDRSFKNILEPFLGF